MPSPNTDVAVREGIGSSLGEGVSEIGGSVGVCRWTVGGMDD